MIERKGILVVDDTLASLKLVTDILIKEGYAVRPAASGEQAIASVEAELPELILLDAKMPGMDGFDVCKQLKASQASRDIPIVFLSAFTDVEERIKGFEAGAIDFITKPFQREELLARVRTHLELSRLQTRLEMMVELRTNELKDSNEKLVHELTERKKTEEELKLRNAILSTQQEVSPDGILVVNAGGRIISYNQNFLKIWNIPVEVMNSGSDELAMKYVLDMLVDSGEFLRKVNYLYSHPFETSYDEIKFIHEKTLERYSAPMTDSDGIYHGRVWFFRDITARKLSEQALRESEEKFRWVIENSNDMIYRRNCKTDSYDYISPAIEKICGYDYEEALEMSHNDIRALILPEDYERNEKMMIAVCKKGGGPLSMEYRFKRKDGRIVWLSESVVVFLDDSGALSHMVGSVRDITIQKTAEIALNREKKITDALLESVPGLLYMYDEAGRLVKWNKRHLEITRYSVEELNRMHYLDWFDDDDKNKVFETVEKMLISGYGDLEVHLKIKDGSKIPFMLTAVPLEIENKKYFVGIGIDITKLKKAEEQIRLSLNEKEVLIRELYHRTKNNMQVICSMLKLYSFYSTDGKILQAFQEMENRIHTMALVHHNLYQSKNLSYIYFHEYVLELCNFIKKSYNISETKIVFKLCIDEISILIDIALPCGLILNELIANSIKHAFPGGKKGEISIELRRGDDATMLLSYRDDGIGFPAGFDFKNNGKFGLQTVYSIGRHQLQGSVDFKSENGVQCDVRFQDKYYAQRI